MLHFTIPSARSHRSFDRHIPCPDNEAFTMFMERMIDGWVQVFMPMDEGNNEEVRARALNGLHLGFCCAGSMSALTEFDRLMQLVCFGSRGLNHETSTDWLLECIVKYRQRERAKGRCIVVANGPAHLANEIDHQIIMLIAALDRCRLFDRF